MVPNPFLSNDMIHMFFGLRWGYALRNEGPWGQPGLECALLGMRRVCAAHGCKARVEDPESGPHPKAAMVPTPFYFKGYALGVCAPHQPIKKRCFPGYALGYALRAGQWIIGFPLRWGVCAPHQPIKKRCFYRRDN